jgi:hypothetical protein
MIQIRHFSNEFIASEKANSRNFCDFIRTRFGFWNRGQEVLMFLVADTPRRLLFSRVVFGGTDVSSSYTS